MTGGLVGYGATLMLRHLDSYAVRTGWQPPPSQALPLAAEVVETVLEPFSNLPEVSTALYLDARVLAVSRVGYDKVKSAGRGTRPSW